MVQQNLMSRLEARKLWVRAFSIPMTLTLAILGGCSSSSFTAPLTITPQIASVRLGSLILLSVVQSGSAVFGGTWSVSGGTANGSIAADGTYTPPTEMPASNIVSVSYQAVGQTAHATLTLLNPVPVISQAAPATLAELSSSVILTGTGFLSGSQILNGGAAVPTIFIDANHLSAKLAVPSMSVTSLSLTVSNPAPGPIVSTGFNLPVTIALLTIAPQTSSLRLGGSVLLTGMQQGSPITGGTWSVSGGAANGSIASDGTYTPPAAMPASNVVSVSYQAIGQTAIATLTLLNPVPVISQAAPATLAELSSSVTLTGTGFLRGSRILVGGAAVPTTFLDANHLSAELAVPSVSITSLGLTISNPEPGAVVSSTFTLPVTIAPLTISPQILSGGSVCITLTLAGLPPNAVVTMDGNPLMVTGATASFMTATGYLPFWKMGSTMIAVSGAGSSQPFAKLTVPITPTAVPYDVAARFAMQAAFGPRHDIIEHIQQIGLRPFIDEQEQTEPDSYLGSFGGRHDFLVDVVTNNTQLRLRTAWAFQSFIPGQGTFQQPSMIPWEKTLEAHAFGNYRQILLDVSSDPNVTTMLNLPGNAASSNPNVHPNQNFARELLQLFSIGTVLLNDDGSPQTDSSGNPLPSYDQSTISDLSRALTGWGYAPPSDPDFTFYGIDYTEPLVSTEALHDHGAKTIFGNVALSAGQTAIQDRDQVLDAIFAHSNLPPFISRRLIQRLVKSQPSPAYIARISKVFEDDGLGVRGNLGAIIKAILLDPEARSGDTKPASDDGYLQDPLFTEIFAMILMDIRKTDDQASYYPAKFGENWWLTDTVFAYYSPDYLVPGTTINSPEFQLVTSTLIIQRSQFLWGMINGPQQGFTPWGVTWLSQTFPTVPSLVDALNHLIYHGTMPQEEQEAIIAYCATLPDQRTQLRTALFLAINGDSYTVVQ